MDKKNMALGLAKTYWIFCERQKYWDIYVEDSINLPELKELFKKSTEYNF